MSSAGTNMNIVPRAPPPLYPDVPWWAVLITALVFAIVGVIAGAYFGIAGLQSTAGKVSFGSFAADTVSYIPHIILLFGVLADMFTLQGVWSIPSLVGILSIFANSVFEYFWKGLDELVRTGKAVVDKGRAPAPVSGGALFEGYTGCAVQGLEDWNTPYAPQTLVVTATVFSYYCYDLVRNRGWINSIGAIISFIAVYLGQTAIIAINTKNLGCQVNGAGFPPFGQSIRALFEGLLFGGISYAIVQTYAPNRLPSAMISPFPAKNVSDLTPGPDGRMYDKDGYPYIVLPNGQAFPDLSDAKSRVAFGEMASSATGKTSTLASNCPAIPAGCPGEPNKCPTLAT
jgi:hypothetical protein